MEGCSRAKDNIWIERFGETIKYKYIYIQPEKNGPHSTSESINSLLITITIEGTKELTFK